MFINFLWSGMYFRTVCLGGNAAELVDVAHGGGAGNDGAEHQRHDHHADEVDEQLAERLEGAAHVGEEHAGDDTEYHTDCHLGRQADASFHRNSSMDQRRGKRQR